MTMLLPTTLVLLGGSAPALCCGENTVLTTTFCLPGVMPARDTAPGSPMEAFSCAFRVAARRAERKAAAAATPFSL